jgi:peptidoglycan/xylan/chitin deacetylase (PgdA/CDA1 family)
MQMKYLDEYKELKKILPHGVRGQLRSFALDTLYLLDQVKGIEASLNKPRVQFLYLHHIFKDEEKSFETLLKKLSVNHQFLSHSEAVEKILKGEIDRPYISISSDDGFKNNIRAAEVLNEFGAKGCFFINPAAVGMTSYEEIKKYCASQLWRPPVDFMNWNDINKLQRMGHEIGSHTMTHTNVSTSNEAFFIDDCHQSFDIIKKQCGEAKHFAYPFGNFSNFNEKGRKIVFNAGFISCASGERGCHIQHEGPLLNEELCIRRDHIVVGRLPHIIHFLVRNANTATVSNNLFPYCTK